MFEWSSDSFVLQMLELPISDDNFTLVNPHNGGMRSVGGYASRHPYSVDSMEYRGLGTNMYGTAGGGNGSGVPRTARTGRAVNYGGPHRMNPDEGDFSVDESTYAFNTQIGGQHAASK